MRPKYSTQKKGSGGFDSLIPSNVLFRERENGRPRIYCIPAFLTSLFDAKYRIMITFFRNLEDNLKTDNMKESHSRRKVCFAPEHNLVIPIENRCSFTNMEKRRYWYSKAAIESMQNGKEEYHYHQFVFFMQENDAMDLIESRHDFSKKEKDRYWYSKEEIEKMKSRCFRDVQRLQATPGGSKKRPSCTRGLEKLTKDGKESFELSLYACMDAVIVEQETQCEDDCDDYNQLAMASQEASKQSVNQAIERAISDEKVARKIYMSSKELDCNSALIDVGPRRIAPKEYSVIPKAA